jgi:hypothetical protein
MKEIKEKTMKRPKRDKEHMAIRKKNNFEDRYAKGIHFDIRSKGCCFITMQTHAGPLEVYIDSMDGLDDAPLVKAFIPGRKPKEVFVK